MNNIAWHDGTCAYDFVRYFLYISPLHIHDYPVIFSAFRGNEKILPHWIGRPAIFSGELSSIFHGKCKTVVLDFLSARAYRKRAEFEASHRFRVLLSSGVFLSAWSTVELRDDCFLTRSFPSTRSFAFSRCPSSSVLDLAMPARLVETSRHRCEHALSDSI